MKRCVIAAAGDAYSGGIELRGDDFTIAADAGYKLFEARGVRCDLIVGDFDSAEQPRSENVIRLKREKDDTDTLAAIRIGLERGCGEFLIYGGLGGRLDHTLANIQCLAFLSRKGCRAELIGDGFSVTAVTDGRLTFDESRRGVISVFSHGDACYGVCESGLKYSLDEAVITSFFPIGVSNEFTGRKAEISVGKGTLIVVYSTGI